LLLKPCLQKCNLLYRKSDVSEDSCVCDFCFKFDDGSGGGGDDDA
jgi:hypothetical protein